LGASFPVIDSFKGLNVAALIVLGRIHQYAVKSPYNYKEKDISKKRIEMIPIRRMDKHARSFSRLFKNAG
jgi:hypothetical protein